MGQTLLTDFQKSAWSGFFVAHGLITRKIDQMLKSAGCVSIDVYDVLLTLETASEGRLIMSDLASRVLLTRSGMTRLTDRLEKQGLLKRESCPNDRRAIYVVITEKGLQERERAWEVYRAGIAEHFSAFLDERDTLDIDRICWMLVKVNSE
jgi:DNA-binding MarR family transcriptional regulator